MAMEEREVTVMRERDIPAIHYTTHAEWRPVDRQRLHPIAARLEAPMRSAAEEKEQLTLVSSTAVSDEEQRQQVDCPVDQDGAAVAELGVRVRAVVGRHSSNVGLLVCTVREHDVGSRAGLLVGDVVMSVNGSEVRSVEQLQIRIASSTGPLPMRVMRHGRRHLTLIGAVQR